MTKPKVLFVHIPKCGGQTVYGILDRIFSWDDAMTIWDYPTKEYRQWVSPREFGGLDIEEVLSYSCLRGHISFDQAKEKLGPLLDDYFVCTLVRDPVDQIVSRWNYIREHTEHRQHTLVHSVSFEQWLAKSVANQQCRYVCGKPDGAYALEVLDAEYDLFDSLDRFDHFVERLCAQFTFSCETYENRNVSRKELSREALQPTIVEQILKRNAEDQILVDSLARRQSTSASQTR